MGFNKFMFEDYQLVAKLKADLSLEKENETIEANQTLVPTSLVFYWYSYTDRLIFDELYYTVYNIDSIYKQVKDGVNSQKK